MADAPQGKNLERGLGLLAVMTFAVGAMIGPGIFVLVGVAAAETGPSVALAYLLAGALVGPAVLSKAELATAMPVAGGTYVYIARSMGAWMGTVSGLGTWLALIAKTAFAVVGLGTYMVLFADVPVLPVSLAVLLILLGLNSVGAAKAYVLQLGIVISVLVVLSTLSGVGATTAKLDLLDPMLPNGFMGIVAGAGLVFVVYAGVTKVCSVAEEIKDPTRNIPMGMLGSLAIVMVLYAVVGTVVTANVPAEQLQGEAGQTAMATAAGIIFGNKWAATGMAVVGCLGMVSVCNAGILASSRFPFAMARDGLVPGVLEKVHPRFGTPMVSIALTGAVLTLLVVGLPVVKLAKLASGFQIFVFCVENIAVMFLRESGATWYRPTFKVPLYPWMPLIGTIGGIGLLFGLGWFPVLGIVGAFALGSVWYLVFVRKELRTGGILSHLRTVPRADDEPADCESIPTVVIPASVTKPVSTGLVRLADALLDQGRIDILRVQELPDEGALGHYLKSKRSRIGAEDEEARLDPITEAHLRVVDLETPNFKDAVSCHAMSNHAEWIVSAWPKHPKLRTIVRHPMAWWMHHPPCDLAVLMERGDVLRSSDRLRVLVIAHPGPYDTAEIFVAMRLARAFDLGCLTLLAVVGDPADVERFAAYHDQLGCMVGTTWRSRIEVSNDPVRTVVEASADYDLLVEGASDQHSIRNLFVVSDAARIAEEAHCSVLRVLVPGHLQHHRLAFDFGPERTATSVAVPRDLREAVLGLRLRPRHAHSLFVHIGDKLAPVCGVERSAITTAVWARERQQPTETEDGVALIAPIVRGATGVTVGVFTLCSPIGFRLLRGPAVDVVIVVAAPMTERRRQLSTFERLQRLATPDLLADLREARSRDDVYEAFAYALGE